MEMVSSLYAFSHPRPRAQDHLCFCVFLFMHASMVLVIRTPSLLHPNSNCLDIPKSNLISTTFFLFLWRAIHIYYSSFGFDIKWAIRHIVFLVFWLFSKFFLWILQSYIAKKEKEKIMDMSFIHLTIYACYTSLFRQNR